MKSPLLQKPVAAQPARRRRIDLGPDKPQYPIYVIGDVHGCFELLLGAEEQIRADIEASSQPGLIILLGDYIDRGPQSASVLEHLTEPNRGGLKRIALCGNHDDALLRFMHDPGENLFWLDVGGRQTLASYGIPENLYSDVSTSTLAQLRAAMMETIPETHVQLLKSLPISLSFGNYLFVHAGIRPGMAVDRQSDEDLLWIREPFLSEGPKMPILVIHGHTPVDQPEFRQGRIGMDTGAFFSGNLSVLKIENGKAKVL